MSLIPDTMSLPQVAAALGESVETFRRNRARYHAQDALPQPCKTVGHLKWDRASFEAWRTRHHPARPKAIHNDESPPLIPASAEEWRDELARAYGSHSKGGCNAD